MSAAAPIKVDTATDQMISHAAHFLSRSKKDLVAEAVAEYVERHRAEIQQGVTDALRHLDSRPGSAVALLTGLSCAELDELGGFSE